MGREVSSEEERKVTCCLTLTSKTRDLVNLYGKGKTFSEKLRSVVEMYAENETTLIRYDTEEQKELGEPTILKEGSIQVFCMAAGKQGVVSEEECLLEVVTACTKKKKIDIDMLKNCLTNGGYIVQVNEDPLDVWVYPKNNEKGKYEIFITKEAIIDFVNNWR
jgi:hypothetical protein